MSKNLGNLNPIRIERSLTGGDRKYRVKKETVSNLENLKLTQFEKHMIQEGIKQVLFAEGTEQVEVFSEKNEFIYSERRTPKETIRFLLDYDMIEEYQF